jgi:hypothetical protein
VESALNTEGSTAEEDIPNRLTPMHLRRGCLCCGSSKRRVNVSCTGFACGYLLSERKGGSSSQQSPPGDGWISHRLASLNADGQRND